MRKVILILLTALFPLCLSAQEEEFEVLLGDCLPTGLPQQSYARLSEQSAMHRLPSIINEWDANKTYHQLVILVEFDDLLFAQENPKELYHRMLNESGYNKRAGAGCMADYYRVQSNGLFNLQFDIYGPYQVSQKAQPYEHPTASTRNYGKESFREAVQKLLEENPSIDFSQYDWDGNGTVNQVVFVYAGIGGNVSSTTISALGYIWPNTSTFSTITTPDGKKISDYTASAELFPSASVLSCGFGTICHEFTHSLGLPDIYPTAKSDDLPFSVCDEWELMDGGNFTNYGWCPPSLTSLERMLLGWQTPIELTEAASITDMPAYSQGGTVYRIRHSNNEYLLLENRQHTGWDAGTPGHGLLIWYVNYDESAWKSNTVNNTPESPRFHPIYADGMDYEQWNKYYKEQRDKDPNYSAYQKSGHMNKRHLSTAPFPYGDVNSLVDEYITNITEKEGGLVSFDFKGGATGIRSVNTHHSPYTYYDLQGCGVENPVRGQLYIVRRADGSMCKSIYR